MRLRNEVLQTGRLLVARASAPEGSERGLLLLVSSVADIQPAARAEAALHRLAGSERASRFDWLDVASLADLAAAEPFLDPTQLTRIEANELAGLDDTQLERLLGPAVERLTVPGAPLFPSVGGAVGTPAEGVQLLAREQDLANLSAFVASGRDLLLLAPRRSGKTSVLRALEKQPPPHHRALLVNLERLSSAAELAARWASLLDEVAYRDLLGQARKDWRAVAQAAAQRMSRDGSTPLLLLDELVFFFLNLQGQVPGEQFPTALKELLEGLSAVLAAAQGRVVIADSLDFTEFLTGQAGLPATALPPPFDTLDRFVLPPLAADDVELRRVLLGTGLVLEAKEREWLCQKVDLALPYPALQFIDRLTHLARSQPNSKPNLTLLETELDRFLDNTDSFREFEEKLARPGLNEPGLASKARRCLHELCTPGLRRSAADLRATLGSERALTWFRESFPLRETEGRVELPSQLFKRWWQRAGSDA